jgi:hypothetical protein
MSALPPKADIETQSHDVRLVPKADICSATHLLRCVLTNFRQQLARAERFRHTVIAACRSRLLFFAAEHTGGSAHPWASQSVRRQVSGTTYVKADTKLPKLLRKP